MQRLIFILSLLSAPVLAQTVTHSSLQQSGIIEPAQVLRSGIEILTNHMNQNRGRDSARLTLYLDENIAPYFDFRRMASWAAGPAYRYLDSQQRSQLTIQIRTEFMALLTRRLSGYRRSHIEYLPPQVNPARKNVTLGVRIHTASGYPLRIDFRLYRTSERWKVYDVVANGASAVSHFRNRFASTLRQRRAVAGY